MSAVRRARLARGAEVLAARLQARPGPDAVHCEVLVVGSGYGGAVAAARLAGATRIEAPDREAAPPAAVWVLERGPERRPGSFPSRFGEMPGEVRFSNQDGGAPRGNVEGLYDLRLGRDVNVLVGNGLGGGSLINAGVMARPLPEVFAAGWPQGLGSDEPALRDGYRRAMRMLRPRRLPESPLRPAPAKLEMLRRLAAGRGRDWRADASADGPAMLRCAATVSHDAGRSAADVEMAACTRCGDCFSGCNQGAKGSLDTSYLAWARRAGAELFCGGWVERLEPGNGHWIVHWRHSAGTLPRPPPLHARRVVLAAGSLGSTEILLRSRSARLRFSLRLGERFSTNGDQIAAVFRHDAPAHAARSEELDAAAPGLNIGPTICGLVRAETAAGPVAVEEFAVPAPLGRLLGEVVTTYGLLHQAVAPGGALRRHAADEAAGHDRLAVSTASLEYSSVLGLMGDDGAGGTITLALKDVAAAWEGTVAIEWPDKEGRLGELFGAQLDWLAQAAAACGGTAVPAPSWQMLPAELPLAVTDALATTVHPLGGCAMADGPDEGVVDDCGRVFDPAGGVHEGLAVLDGAIVPRALGINPALTIAALAERALPALAATWALRLADADALPAGDLGALDGAPPRRAPETAGATGFRIREQMHGWLRIGGRRWWAQLEVPALDLNDLASWLPQQHRQADLVAAIGGEPRHVMLRLYDTSGDDPDDAPGERPDDRNWVAQVRLQGRLSLYEIQRPGCLAAACAYLRGAALVWDRYRADAGRAPAPKALKRPLWRRLLAVLRALRTLTQWRRLVYTMVVAEVRTDDTALASAGLRAGALLRGVKTLGLTRKGNPWRQLSELELELRGADGTAPRALGRLRSDLGYFARWRELLGSLTTQRDQPTALADLGALLLLTLRIVLYTHWPLFIPPGDMPQRIGERRPGAREPGHPAPVGQLLNGHGAQLFHYAAEVPAADARPVLLIHGLSAAGSTFVHPSIPGNLVRFLNRHGRDAWVLELRTSSALGPPRRGPYRFEEVATGDIVQALRAVSAATAAASGRAVAEVRVDVVAHCIGAAMFCLAVLHRDLPRLHERIGRVVLSQVGPYTTMSPFNRLRGLVAGFLQDYLGLEELDTRPDFEFDAPAGRRGSWDRRPRPSGALAMVDALLATFPYPADDDESARAQRLACRRGRGHDFRRVRHRADGIFGHTLHLDNVGDETLLALDAIYGWVKTGTLAQTIHMAREGVLTHGDGDNESVSGARLAARFDFPLLLLHGRRNQVFDWLGSLASHRALRQAFLREPAAAVDRPTTLPGGDRLWGAGGRHRFLLLERYGHQDTLIGCRVQDEVFPHVEAFLADRALARAAPASASKFVCEMPWMGPMLGHPRGDRGAFRLNLLVHPGARRAETCCIVFVPVAPERRQVGHRLDPSAKRVWVGNAARAFGMRLRGPASGRPPGHPGAPPAAAPLPERSQLRDRALTLRLAFDARVPLAWPLHYAVLVLCREQQGAGDAADDFLAPGDPPRDPLRGGEPLSAAATQAVQAFLDEAATEPWRIDGTVLTIDEPHWLGRDLGAAMPGAPLCFALGSCQFPAAMFDKVVAGHAWRRLGERLSRKPGEVEDLRPQFMLLLGDQVYLDALGNVFEAPGRRPDERARRAYEANWRLSPLRSVARRLPIYAMLDDHEIVNDWQPPAPGDSITPEARAALRAYGQHQAKLCPPAPGWGSFSYRFAPAGVPFVVLDSRTRRQPRDPAEPASAQIIDPQDLASLLHWLDLHRDAPAKFIALPAFLLPIERPELRDAEKLRLDGASGYPATQHAILAQIRDEQIRGVVLLGGDAHLSAVTSFAIAGGPTVVAIVASGLYAPWPFINAKPAELLLDGAATIRRDGHAPVRGTSILHDLCTGPAVTLITLQPAAAACTLRVRFLAERSSREPVEIRL